ncbi:hypothetical protein NST38_31490 [Paenibacillus sp. FSL H8-0104]|uniref:hypothetical protein n=1 Tax=Paenibacillus sp. FSL H8-0104 TaxID=2954509 RepID=UPI0030FD46D0
MALTLEASVLKAISKIDLNLTPIEKVESRMKIKRKAGPTLFFIIIFLLFFYLSFKLFNQMVKHNEIMNIVQKYIVIGIWGLIIFGIIIVVLHRKWEHKLPPPISVAIWILILFSYVFINDWLFFYYLWELISNGWFSIDLVKSIIPLTIFNGILYANIYTLYFYFLSDFIIEIELANQKKFQADLTGITKSGDYVVRIENNIEGDESSEGNIEIMYVRAQICSIRVIGQKVNFPENKITKFIHDTNSKLEYIL